jgi:hypothetical protein
MMQQAAADGDAGVAGSEVHEAKFKRTKKYGKVCVDPLPPEEVLISRETPTTLTKARFVEHRTLRTLSDIREMGYKVDDDIADYAPNADFNLERVERLKFDDALLSARRRMQTIRLPRECGSAKPTPVDYDGDGIAELRKVTKVGKTILDNEEFDSLPDHRWNGGPDAAQALRIVDLRLIGDIQLQRPRS